MTYAVDPILSNVFFAISLLPHFRTPTMGLSHAGSIRDYPDVSVLIPFIDEERTDIDLTLSSLAAQTYPPYKMEVLLLVEPDDGKTKSLLTQNIRKLQREGVSVHVIETDGKVKMKPHALNAGILKAKGTYCAFYDAGDRIDVDQIEKAISVMEAGKYDVSQAVVVRSGPSLLSRFLRLDTLMWYRKYLPFALKGANGFPLSGEGLFIRKDVLLKVGFFREVLTEDADIGLRLAEHNMRFALINSTVEERAPKNIYAHVVQRMRWFRGYLSCLKSLWGSSLSLDRKFYFFLLYVSPINSALALLAWVLLILAGLSGWTLFDYNPLVQVFSGTSIWAVPYVIMIIGLLVPIFSYGQVLLQSNLWRDAYLLVLMPMYWAFVGFCAVCSFFRGTSYWGRTKRACAL